MNEGEDSLLPQARAAAAQGEDDEVLRLTATLPEPVAPSHCEAHALRAQALFRRADFTTALVHALQALEGWRRLGVAEGECRQWRALAITLTENGVHDRALVFARRAFDLADREGLEQEARLAMSLVGTLCGRVGDDDTGEALLMQALSRARETGRHDAVAMAATALLGLLNHALQRQQAQGDSERAAATRQRTERQALQVLALAATEPAPFARAIQLGNAGEALMQAGRLDDAGPPLHQSLALALEGGFALVALRARGRLVLWQLRGGHLDAAALEAQAMADALAVLPHAEAAEDLARCRAALARARGDEAAATALEREILPLQQAREVRADALRAVLGPDPELLPARLAQLEQRLAEDRVLKR